MKRFVFAGACLLLALAVPLTRSGTASARMPSEAAVAAGQDAAGQASSASTVANGSFEDVDGAVPRGWKTATFERTKARFEIAAAGHSGSRSVRITAEEAADAAWTTVALVKPYAKYRLSAWIKTEGVDAGTGKGALLALQGRPPLQTAAVAGTNDWTRVEVVFDSDGNDAIQVNCLLGGRGKSKGTAWFDDVALELLSARELKPAVTVNAARTREPMSKFIYGQFIEHLGRCIYGGIWAEMLEDRKFYYAVGDKDSPWKAVGAASGVSMSKDAPFVGEHTPVVTLAGGKPGGIEQAGLALVKGKRYVGRVVLSGDQTAGPVQVSLAWGAGDADRQTVNVARLGPGYETTPLSFTAPVSTEDGRLVITAGGRGALRIGTVSLMPADNVDGFRSDTLALLRELNAPVYRWPGGNFVSGYNWRDGIGNRDKRPPRKNPAWTGVEHNDVGLHEFLAFCRLVDAEPYIAVNSGLGDAGAAADEVEYVNGAASTPMGTLRAANGHPQAWHCRYWSIGNEMYGDWQLGHMALKDYVQKHNAFAAAMRAKSADLELIGVGAVGPWSEAMLAECADNMSLMSEHFYCQERPGLLSHVSQIPNEVRRIAEAHRKYRESIASLKGKDIRIALDEWNYWYGPHLYGELGTQYFLKDALGIAAGLHEYSRQSDIIFMANYAQTVNVIGAIKTSKTDAVLDTTGMVLKMYRQHFGTTPVETGGAPEPLDVAAAWTEGKKSLTIAIVNPTAVEQGVDLDVAGMMLPASARVWRISGSDPKACNVPGKPPQVAIKETASAPFGRRITVPPLSASIYELK